MEYRKLKPLILNPKSKITYRPGCFLGKGSFGRCYEFRNVTTGEIFAGKVVSKTMLIDPQHKVRMFQEIQIHSKLSHKFIVSMHSHFEDESNMYIILELCSKRSLWEMHNRRKTLSIPEVRYFMRQIVLACKYLHDNKVIHRDLKLANIFINNDMDIKVGDFGLATTVNNREKNETLCGTPNYIAPEILTKWGHSYEVDIWSIGCIMYTLLVGNPPFESGTERNIYTRIKKCQYNLPPKLNYDASQLIKKLLHPDPKMRPNADMILEDDFITYGYIPRHLPQSCLTMEPRFSHSMTLCEVSNNTRRGPLTESMDITKALAELEIEIANIDVFKNQSSMPEDFYLGNLLQMLKNVMGCNLEAKYTGHSEDVQDPSAIPFIWISKWVDYSDKHGFGYQLCDNTIGMFFNDATHLLLLQDGEILQYIEQDSEQYYSMENYPSKIKRKVTILIFCSSYMANNLVTAGKTTKPRKGGELAHIPYVRAWFRTELAIIFHLTNGTFQANFFQDHTKIILCPLMGAVSFIDENKHFTVYSMKLIKKYGCFPLLAKRLLYSITIVEKLYTNLQRFKNAE